MTLCGQARLIADLLQGIQDRLVGILRAACVLPAGVDVITVRIDDMLMNGKGRRGEGGGWSTRGLDLSSSWQRASS